MVKGGMVETVRGEVMCIWFKAGGKGGIGFVDNGFGCGTEQIEFTHPMGRTRLIQRRGSGSECIGGTT